MSLYGLAAGAVGSLAAVALHRWANASLADVVLILRSLGGPA